jgi:Dihydrofolate reductase
MRNIVLDLAVTLDGFIEGPNGEIDWCIMDDDMGFDQFLESIDTIFYGRVSYDMWGNYRPDEKAGEAEKQLWQQVHSKKKYVFSSQQKGDHYISTDKVREIKAQTGKDIWLYGGAKLIETFMDLGMVDVYRLSVHPVVLGAGKPLFRNLKERKYLELVEVNRFRSGVVQLIYNQQQIK